MGVRQTKIVCTIGPATATRDGLGGLLDAGMDVARFNLSYGTHAEHAQTLAWLREAAADRETAVAVLFDLPGPKLRTGALPGGVVDLVPDTTVRLVPGGSDAPDAIPYRYPALARDVRPGDRVLLQDGEIALEVRVVRGEEVICAVRHGGRLRQHAGISLPGIRLSTPAVTSEDLVHLEFALAQEVDYVALSFVERAEDLHRVRRILEERGASLGVVAKIERRQAVEASREIIAATDAVMVARGDLAVETAPEEVPVIQKDLIAACRGAGVPIIIATQMLESMIERPRPTRAEAADVANAVFDGADAVMLSAETAIGRFPVQATSTMARIAGRAETARPAEGPPGRDPRSERNSAEAIALAAVQAAEAIEAAAIVAATTSGSTARRVARLRPHRPILAVTTSPATRRRLRLVWGVQPAVIEEVRDLDALIAAAVRAAQHAGVAHPGDTLVVTAGYPMGRPGTTNLLKVVRVDI